jgi:hypothetical protein
MRRALLAVIAGSTLLAGSACDSDAKIEASATEAPSAAATASPTPEPDYSASTKEICGRLQSLYTTELRAFGSAMGKMVTYKEEKQVKDAEKYEKTAADQLKAAATRIRKETGEAESPGFQAAGRISASKLETSAKDRRYMDKVKSLSDLNKTVQAQFAQWLTPVAGYCGPTSGGASSAPSAAPSVSS